MEKDIKNKCGTCEYFRKQHRKCALTGLFVCGNCDTCEKWKSK
jgi:hypothetical protein